MSLTTRTLLQRLFVATAVSVVAVGLTACRGQSDIKELRKKAEQGFALARYNLGVRYHKGQGVPQDYAASPLKIPAVLDLVPGPDDRPPYWLTRRA